MTKHLLDTAIYFIKINLFRNKSRLVHENIALYNIKQ